MGLHRALERQHRDPDQGTGLGAAAGRDHRLPCRQLHTDHLPAVSGRLRRFRHRRAEYRGEWDRFDLWRYRAGTAKSTTRAYSMANYPQEDTVIMLVVRIAIPPPGASDSVPPGVVSSYIFGLRPGDTVKVSEFMSPEVTTIEADTDIVEVTQIFLRSWFRRYPVMADGRLVGVLSRYDVLRALEELW
jgi:CBS domain-containing protein